MTTKKTTKKIDRRPRILVLEAAGGSATNAVMRSGAIPVRINPRNVEDVEQTLEAAEFDGMLLTGGGDVDPRLYGEKPLKQVYGVSEARDYAEWMALDAATAMCIPVMGICRGMQLIAIHNGGALKQHVDGHRGVDHPVVVEDRSAFGVIVGERPGAFPSLHHQIVRRHGRGMKVGARSKEGYIEAIETLDRRVVAVQFHPEYDYATNESSRRLFDWLAQAAAKNAGLVRPERRRIVEAAPSRSYVRSTPVPKRRPRKSNPIGRWFCRDCGMLFDLQRDRDDHENMVCGAVLAGTSPRLRAVEPPPGHPDWETSR